MAVVVAKWQSVCPVCRGPISPGEYIVTGSSAARHAECPQEDLARKDEGRRALAGVLDRQLRKHKLYTLFDQASFVRNDNGQRLGTTEDCPPPADAEWLAVDAERRFGVTPEWVYAVLDGPDGYCRRVPNLPGPVGLIRRLIASLT